MSEGSQSIVFLAIFILVPVGLVALVVLNVVRRIRQKRGLAAVAESRGWAHGGSGSEVERRLHAVLDSTLFAMQSGSTHTLDDVVEASESGLALNLARYSMVGQSNIAELGRGGVYRLVVLRARPSVPPFWLHAPFGVAIGSLMARLSGGHLGRVDDGNWSWALVSSAAAARDASLTSQAVAALREAVQPGGFLFIFPDCVILMERVEPDAAWAADAPERARKVKAALSL